MSTPPSPAAPTRGFVDTHQHYWRYDAKDYAWIDDRMAALRRDFGPVDVAGAMSRTGFTESVAVQARQTPDETEALLAIADRHPSVVGVVGWVDLRADDVEARLAHASRHPKLVGVRHIVQDEPDDRFLLGRAFRRGVRCLEQFGLTYDILVYPRHLPVVATFLDEFPHHRFVVDHLAKPQIRAREIDRWARDLEAVAAHPHVMAKVSGLVTEADWARWRPADLRPYLDVAWDVFGPDRLMVGSDWPVCTVAASYEQTMGVVLEYLSARPPHERHAVLGDNARRFWRLDVGRRGEEGERR
jgi:L-fuconolactonase